MRHVCRAAALLFLFWGSFAAAQPVVSITGGQIRGKILQDGSAVFQGVPYAAAPIGPLRWRAPQPADPWSGIRDASTPAPACLQVNPKWTGPGRGAQSEDCLYLELRTPSLQPSRPLPVMVWIHGGGNAAGSSMGAIMSSIPARGVVLVSVQYRLGPFGFMSHPALTAEGNNGNFGVLDQQAALQWVRANIRRFGGDPENITLFGSSAGAQAVGLMMIRPEVKGLFHKAIMQSGTPEFGAPMRTLAENEATGRAIVAKAGAQGETAVSLRALPSDALVSATVQHLGLAAGTFWARAVLDGQVLRERPSDLLGRGAQVPVPLLIGTNVYELANPEALSDPAQMIRSIAGTNAAKLLAHYGLSSNGSNLPQAAREELGFRISTDQSFRCPAAALVAAHLRRGAPVWQYQFGYRQPQGPPVRHFSELRYVFNAPGERGLPSDAPPLQQYWVNFARSGDPNGPGLPEWPAVKVGQDSYLSLSNSGHAAATGLRPPSCETLRRAAN